MTKQIEYGILVIGEINGTTQTFLKTLEDSEITSSILSYQNDIAQRSMLKITLCCSYFRAERR